MAEKRLYVVSDAIAKVEHLVMAVSGAAALRHVVKPVYLVQIASAHDVAMLMGKGVAVEQADGEDELKAIAGLDPTGTTTEALRHSDAIGNKVKVPK